MLERPKLKKKVFVSESDTSSSNEGKTEELSQVSQASPVETSPSKKFGFGFGVMRELTDAFKNAQELSIKAKRLQQDLESLELVSKSEGGVVAIYSGNLVPLQITIAEELISEPIETIEAEILIALQGAYHQSKQVSSGKVKELAKRTCRSVDYSSWVDRNS